MASEGNMTDDEAKRAAEEYADSIVSHGHDYWRTCYLAFIAGYRAARDEARELQDKLAKYAHDTQAILELDALLLENKMLKEREAALLVTVGKLQVDEFLQRVEERTEKASSARSDDFGHDTQQLLEWESQQLQVACEDIEKLVKLVRMLSEACSYYGEKKNWGESDPDIRNWYPIESRDRGDKARHALKECGEIVNE